MRIGVYLEYGTGHGRDHIPGHTHNITYYAELSLVCIRNLTISLSKRRSSLHRDHIRSLSPFSFFIASNLRSIFTRTSHDDRIWYHQSSYARCEQAEAFKGVRKNRGNSRSWEVRSSRSSCKYNPQTSINETACSLYVSFLKSQLTLM